jgi:hypothetical protein
MSDEKQVNIVGESFTAVDKSITGSRNLTSQSITTNLMTGQFSPFNTPSTVNNTPSSNNTGNSNQADNTDKK